MSNLIKRAEAWGDPDNSEYGFYDEACALIPLLTQRVIELEKQLAERDAEIALLRQQSVGWVQVFDENSALRAEVERLKEHASDYGNALITVRDETRKQTAREVEKHLLGMHWTIPYHETEAMIDRDEAIFWVRQRYGLEGEG